MEYRLAVEMLSPGATAAVPASLRMSAENNADLSSRTAVLYNQKIVKADSPGG